MIKSKRLQLIPLTLEHLEMLQKNRLQMEISMGLKPSNLEIDPIMNAEMQEAIPHWILLVKSYEKDYSWFTNWEIVLTKEGRSIGCIGLSGLPNTKGEVGAGYVIDNHYHRRGYATEALNLMKDWVFRNAKVKMMIAETTKENYPSQKVLKKVGFGLKEEKKETFVWCLER